MDKTCIKCGSREYYAKGLCKKCYKQNWHAQQYYEDKEKVLAKNKNWRDQHPSESRAARIRACRKRGVLPMDKNKECGAYLGIHVAERVLSKIFKNVERQPNNTPGFDFICGRGFKIDVKSSCLYKGNRETVGSWMFHIRQNKTAEYFLCLAFDNRDKLNPIYMWLLPGDNLNHREGVGISTNTIDKWNQYSIPINKVSMCCKNIKGEQL